MDPLALLGKLLDAVLRIIPQVTVIRSTHRGVLWVCGRWVFELRPGVWPWWPLVMGLEVVPVVAQPQDLYEKPSLTKDLESVTYDGTIVFRVADARLALTTCDSIPNIVQAMATPEIRAAINQRTLQEVVEALVESQLQEELTNAIRDRLQPYGIEVVEAQVTGFGKSQTLHHVGQAMSVSMGVGGT
jgi:regulator of protease activity HflC (stomatin/prohibitin superfamily)